MNQSNYAWLEPDFKHINDRLTAYMENGFTEPSINELVNMQFKKDKIIMLKLLEIVKMQRENLDAISTNYKAHGDVLTFSELAKETLQKTAEMLKQIGE